MDKSIAISALRRELDLPECLARILVRNGLAEPGQADDFLQPRLKNLSDPFLLPNMAAAVERVLRALERNEKIVLYGDYDVDGVASLALLQRFLSALGARVTSFLPHRIEEGYGLSPSGVERCVEEHSPQLLIAVDCGTNSFVEVAQFYASGAEVIILDHHEPSSQLPQCEALVNPKLDGRFAYLCSAGVTFKLAHALLKRVPNSDIDLKDYLDLVALATVADIVPLIDENRILVHRGLQQMAQTRWPGLRALMTVADVRVPIQSSDIGFRLGPRINASGRLGTAQESLRLLLSNEPQEAARLADSLDRQNRERQSVEKSLIQEVETWVAEHYDAERDVCIVAGQRDWHHGVLGIVAARIMRRHHRPTLLVGFDEEGLGKGSGRSIEGISLVEALSQCSEHLDKFGGHEMAAGVTVQEGRFESFREAFRQSARSLVNQDILTPKLRLDAEIDLNDISFSLLEQQQRLEPYGQANVQPIFAARGVTPNGTPRVLKEKHLKLEFQAGRQRLGAIYFNGAIDPLPRPPWDLAFTIERNEFNGRTDVQIQVVAIRSSI